jgi:hypothetical protein
VKINGQAPTARENNGTRHPSRRARYEHHGRRGPRRSGNVSNRNFQLDANATPASFRIRRERQPRQEDRERLHRYIRGMREPVSSACCAIPGDLALRLRPSRPSH